ncbi:uncharacterized protein BDW43DRAFT_259246 [Aspergillus alliaceus]|uniref:uncharacterized protein n=1 Tax=Petromyces alliaceus TaxID=209559 RepID=UPI0012A65BC0|nr:uncharacterized protein BDW43DRAFT_259246 [Aspergillus alliaceus]KAB8239803.1 hypothetical protein BDW43DRAFT_259246 [Aspergillus alliaceus]
MQLRTKSRPCPCGRLSSIHCLDMSCSWCFGKFQVLYRFRSMVEPHTNNCDSIVVPAPLDLSQATTTNISNAFFLFLVPLSFTIVSDA